MTEDNNMSDEIVNAKIRRAFLSGPDVIPNRTRTSDRVATVSSNWLKNAPVAMKYENQAVLSTGFAA